MIDPKTIIDTISDKKQVLKNLLDMIGRNQKQLEGCMKLRESITREDPNHSNANLARCLDVTLAVSAKNSEDILNLAQLILVYSQSSGFTTDMAEMANKMGHGQEALRAMFKAKMEGR
jgi:hypothetical protein